MITNWIGWDPLFGVDRSAGDIGRLFGRWFDADRTGSALPLRVTESAEGLRLEADLPGVDPSAVEVTADGGRLMIRATRAEEAPGEGIRVTRQERWAGTIERSLTVSDDFDLGAVEAEYHHGRLALRVPRRPETKPRRIEVKAAS